MAAPQNDGSLLNEDCSGIGDWNDDDQGTGVSSQETFQAEETFKLTNVNAGGGNRAIRSRDIGSYPTEFIIESRLWHTALGINAANDDFRFIIDRANLRLQISFASDGFFIHDGVGFNEVGVNIVSIGQWDIWVLKVDATAGDANAVMDVWKNDVSMGVGIDCSLVGARVDGNTVINQFGFTQANRLTNMDYLKIGLEVSGIPILRRRRQIIQPY